MTIIIDGHNLIGKLPNISLSDPDDEAKLVRVLENYHAMHLHEAILVVFDPGHTGGWTELQHGAGVQVRFAPRGSTADAVIVKLVRQEKKPRRITVVSSDNAIRKAAREHGAKTIASEAFVVKLREQTHPRKRRPAALPPEAREKPSDADVEYWSKFFQEPIGNPAPPKPVPIQPAASRPAQSETSREVEDIEYWLKVFGEPQASTPEPDAKSKPRQPSTESDVEYWLKRFERKR